MSAADFAEAIRQSNGELIRRLDDLPEKVVKLIQGLRKAREQRGTEESNERRNTHSKRTVSMDSL